MLCLCIVVAYCAEHRGFSECRRLTAAVHRIRSAMRENISLAAYLGATRTQHSLLGSLARIPCSTAHLKRLVLAFKHLNGGCNKPTSSSCQSACLSVFVSSSASISVSMSVSVFLPAFTGTRVSIV